MNKLVIIILLISIVLITGCFHAPASKYANIKENIFACKDQLSGYDGKIHTICFDDKGNKLFDEVYDVLIELKFSEEDIIQIKENYRSGCVSKIKYSEIPSNIITQFILKSDLFNQQDVCLNVDDSIYSWSYNDHKYYHSITSSIGGGLQRGTIWRLTVEPYTTKGINSEEYPFLACEEEFRARLYSSWHFSVKKDGDSLIISANDIKPPVQAPKLGKNGLKKLAEDFTFCTASYYYTAFPED